MLQEATVSADSNSPLEKTTATKLCHIVKRIDFEGYGFNLHSEKVKLGQFIGKVDAGSPAEAAGLKKGDRIIEVNGIPIHNETHKQVVQLIKAIESEVRLLLVAANNNVDGEHFTDNEVIMRGGGGGVDCVDNTTQPERSEHIVQPGASANISSISISSTVKRKSNSSNNHENLSGSNGNRSNSPQENINAHQEDSKMHDMELINNNNNNNAGKHVNTAAQLLPPSYLAGGLKLPMTAAEMRAQLSAKKKYDPKSEVVDLKKKFEIIQKL